MTTVFDPVGSTSWHNRHLSAFRRLDGLLREHGPANPEIMIVGPGGVSTLAAPFLNDAENAGASRLRKLIGDAARYGDQAMRRIPGMPLRTLEPIELTRTLTVPHRLIVVDRSRRILESVARQAPGAACYLVDVSFQKPPVAADVIIAFNVICRLDDPEAGLANVVGALREGGFLLMDDRSARGRIDAWPELCRVAEKTYRRTGGKTAESSA